MFVPGAITLYPFRILTSIGSMILLVIWLKIVTIGHEWNEKPFTGLR